MNIKSPACLAALVASACSLFGCASARPSVTRSGADEMHVVGPVYSAQGELELGAGDDLGLMVHNRSSVAARRAGEAGREVALQGPSGVNGGQ